MLTHEKATNKEIIVFDNDEHVISILRHILERSGYAVRSAIDGYSMSQFISSKQPPDLVILDSILPKVDGFQLITLIRNQPSWKKTPIVMLTASFSENSAVRAFNLGADDYITKPFRPSELLARLKRLLPED